MQAIKIKTPLDSSVAFQTPRSSTMYHVKLTVVSKLFYCVVFSFVVDNCQLESLSRLPALATSITPTHRLKEDNVAFSVVSCFTKT